MEEWNRKIWAGLLAIAVLGGCHARPSVDELQDVQTILDNIGRRLSNSHSAQELTDLSTSGASLLKLLKAGERDALSRGYLKFRTGFASTIYVAVPEGPPPFWLADQGFHQKEISLATAEGRWVVFHKQFPAGWVGLGVNGLDRTPRSHYSVFIKRSPAGTSLAPEEVILNESDEGRYQKVLARGGISSALDLHDPFLTLPKELEGAVLIQPRHDRRHATLLATSRVWKTHQASNSRPDQVSIAFGQDSSRELSWSWRSGPEVSGSAVRIVPARFESAENDELQDPDLAGVRIVQGESTLFRSSNLLNDPLIRRHRVQADGLEPDTTYLYSLGDGNPKHWGPWRSVRTGPARSRRTEFLYLGDAQTGLEDWGRRLSLAVRRHPALDFVLLAGDLVDRGNERTNWDHFFLRAEEVFDRIPFMPCVGNHEYLDRGPRHYQAFFNLPRNGPPGVPPNLLYHFEHGDVFFAVLDSTIAVFSPVEATRQAAWLDDALARTRARWKFVMFHHPVYASHPSRDYPILGETWVPVFDKHHVDMVLQGHDHAYLRTYAMRANRRVEGPHQGTVYVVSVSGDKFYEQVEREYLEVGLTNTSTYQTIEIDGLENHLTYRAWNDDGQVVDRLDIRKPRGDLDSRVAERVSSEPRR